MDIFREFLLFCDPITKCCQNTSVVPAHMYYIVRFGILIQVQVFSLFVNV